jgi:hypothetical protein
MPFIHYVNQIDVTPERFLKACSVSELLELQLLLDRPEYADKMYPKLKEENNERT